MIDYDEFIRIKSHSKKPERAELKFTTGKEKDFQLYLLEFLLGETRAACFADTGMGKTLMQLVWAKNVYLLTGKPVLGLAPLLVLNQTALEAEKFGIDGVRVARDGIVSTPITITNYEQLSKFDPKDFGGVFVDESGILKSMDGVTRNAIIAFMRHIEYRALFSATPSPNDYTELGSSSEALGIMGQTSMLSKFFNNGRDTTSERRHFGNAPKWSFRGHAEKLFWPWVSGWARAIRKPSDIGFSDEGYILPDPVINYHKIEVPPPEGMLFCLPTANPNEQRKEIKRTIQERCETVAELTNHDRPFISFCNLNPEAKLLKKLIPDAVEVSGTDSDDAKIEKISAFVSGQVRGLITKPKIAAWGLNFQHAAHLTYFPNHSYEQWYQSLRRCHRYGQQNVVVADVVYTPGEQRIVDNMGSKARKAEDMYRQLVACMNNPMYLSQTEANNNFEAPPWLSA